MDGQVTGAGWEVDDHNATCVCERVTVCVQKQTELDKSQVVLCL
jgi:hypothetical protein